MVTTETVLVKADLEEKDMAQAAWVETADLHFN